MYKLSISFLLVLNCLHFVISAKFPSNWKKCPKTDNEECLKEAIEGAMANLKDGNKKFGILPMDPLRFERMEIIPKSNNPVAINLTLFNGALTGSSTIKVSSAKIDWDKHTMEIEYMDIGEASLLGDYSVDGKILVLPIKGNGKANFTMEEFKAKVMIKGSEFEKKGEKYFNVDECIYSINPKKAHIYLGNLFNGVPNLGDNMNKFMNENSELILTEMKDMLSNAFGDGIKDIANSFFHKVPMNQLYTT